MGSCKYKLLSFALRETGGVQGKKMFQILQGSKQYLFLAGKGKD